MAALPGTEEVPEPSLPPLFSGEAATAPFDAAIAAARDGTDPGLITYNIPPDHLSAALVLAPEAPLEDAMAMILAAANGFADAFGALAPSEVACQFDWPGGLRINGARCGALRALASTGDPAAEPDWLVVGLDVPFFAEAEREPGETPDRTTLWEEGCSEIEPLRLLESWSRHTLVWIHEWLDNGIPRLHRDWMGRAFSVGETVTVDLPTGTESGVFTGLDERGGLLLKQGEAMRLLPLSAMLEGSK
ncbi:biotin/lipoate--protein ligase family protein [Ovoidimarina sediminis]|uniref:biotin/lipoate--protein ligase family protein n=1 Tax=Ovoidimarina sediminis TaxID=3079856 RepID=UPI002910B680|nr:biotin/lipoate--protein ligase family protein [Rhodophyticola sp. MJ-SS7]MDU8942060.1 biotin/lipoate--protein ligase family protein [Rhodophyticola sp. MJ-SS7]